MTASEELRASRQDGEEVREVLVVRGEEVKRSRSEQDNCATLIEDITAELKQQNQVYNSTMEKYQTTVASNRDLVSQLESRTMQLTKA